MTLPDLAFSDYFRDHNHEHNIDEEDVDDAVFGRRILITREYVEDGKRRRRIYAKNDHTTCASLWNLRIEASGGYSARIQRRGGRLRA